MSWDLLFKNFMSTVFSGKDLKISTDYAVGTRERKIDTLLTAREWNTEKAHEIIGVGHIPFLLRTHNLFEYKSRKDPLTAADIFSIFSYFGEYGYRELKDFIIALNKLKYIIIVAEPPRNLADLISAGILKKAKKEDIFDNKTSFEPDLSGYYTFNFIFKAVLIIIDELPVNEYNCILKLLGGKSSLKSVFNAFLKGKINNKRFSYFFMKSFILNSGVLGEMAEVINTKFKDDPELKSNIKRAVELLGIRKVVEAVGVEEVVEAVGVKKVVEAVGVKKVVEAVGVKKVVEAIGIEEIIKAYGPEKIEEALKRIKNNGKT